jgi:hypothetical protein
MSSATPRLCPPDPTKSVLLESILLSIAMCLCAFVESLRFLGSAAAKMRNKDPAGVLSILKKL